jgi:Proteasome assembly chaperone 4
MDVPRKSLQLALPLPKIPRMTIHLHLTFFATTTMVFLTTTASGDHEASTPMGSFVYAMPNVPHLPLPP